MQILLLFFHYSYLITKLFLTKFVPVNMQYCYYFFSIFSQFEKLFLFNFVVIIYVNMQILLSIIYLINLIKIFEK